MNGDETNNLSKEDQALFDIELDAFFKENPEIDVKPIDSDPKGRAIDLDSMTKSQLDEIVKIFNKYSSKNQVI